MENDKQLTHGDSKPISWIILNDKAAFLNMLSAGSLSKKGDLRFVFELQTNNVRVSEWTRAAPTIKIEVVGRQSPIQFSSKYSDIH